MCLIPDVASLDISLIRFLFNCLRKAQEKSKFHPVNTYLSFPPGNFFDISALTLLLDSFKNVIYTAEELLNSRRSNSQPTPLDQALKVRPRGPFLVSRSLHSAPFQPFPPFLRACTTDDGEMAVGWVEIWGLELTCALYLQEYNSIKTCQIWYGCQLVLFKNAVYTKKKNKQANRVLSRFCKQ